MHLVASIRPFVCVFVSQLSCFTVKFGVNGGQFGVKVAITGPRVCLFVCNQGACADNLADAGDQLLILRGPAYVKTAFPTIWF